MAFKILDTGSQGGIIVSPLGLQKGSKEVANAMNIVHVQLDENSTNHEYVLRWLTEVMMGAQDTVGIRIEESSEIRIVSQDRASMKS